MPVYFCYMLIPFTYSCAECLKWWEHLHVVCEYISSDMLSRDNMEITISYFLICHKFPIPTLFFISSSFSIVQTQSVLLIYFGMNRKFWSWFPRAHICRKYTITWKCETEDLICTLRGLQLSVGWTEAAAKLGFFFVVVVVFFYGDLGWVKPCICSRLRVSAFASIQLLWYNLLSCR